MIKKDLMVWAEVNLDYLRSNLRVVRSMLRKGRSVDILAVVKADAYGHGMKKVVAALRTQGVRFFGVATIDEALELRRSCPREKILVLGSFHENQVSFFVQKNIIPTLSSFEDAALFENYLKSKKIKTAAFPVHVKIDTGMGRLGVWHEEAEIFLRQLKNCKKIAMDGLYTHFSRADHDDKIFMQKQLDLFEQTIRIARSLGFSPKYFHAANSMGLVRLKSSHLNLVRPGIILYGVNPRLAQRPPKGLRPILSLKTRISFLKYVKKGRAISYGGTYETPESMLIATLPVGYSHGYRVGYSNKAHVVVRGRKCPVVGRVTMDQTLVNVDGVPDVKRWDEVTLIGSQGRLGVSLEDLALLINSIPYEVACSIHSRIPRVYKG